MNSQTWRRAVLAAVLVLAGLAPVSAQNYTITPTPFQTAFDNAGKVINNACVWTYNAGTTTAATTYSDTAGTPNLNPIRSDSAGRFTAYLVAGTNYKFVYESSCTPPSHGTVLRTADNISGTPSASATVDVTGTAGETISAGQCAYLSDGSGSKLSGQWYKCDSAADYASTRPQVGLAPSAITSGATGTIRLLGSVTGLSSLATGSTYYAGASGALTTTRPGTGRVVGVADSATSLVVTADPGPIAAAAAQFLTGTAGEAISAGNVVYLSDGSGSKTAGSWYKADSGNGYSSTAPIIGIAPAAVASTATGSFQIGGIVGGLSALTAGTSYYVGTSGAVTSTAPGAVRRVGVADTTTSLVLVANPPVPAVPNLLAGGRLTLTTAVPVTVTDVTAATTLYYTPYKHNRIALYDGSFWQIRTFSEISIAVPATTAQMYDVFAFDSSGTLTLELLAWTNDTTRATALVLQDGVLVKTGVTTRRYLGSFRTAAVSGQTEDSRVKRFVYNYDNRVPRALLRQDTTDTWNYNTAAYRQANGAAANQIEIVNGWQDEAIDVRVDAMGANSVGGVSLVVAVGEDSTTTRHADCNALAASPGAGFVSPLVATLRIMPAVGWHRYVWLEFSGATITTTFYGDSGGTTLQSGISGTWFN